jgi:glycosyltransferase involved in cell wall biosynthesis
MAIKIVNVIGQLTFGGAEKLVVDLCEKINKKDYEVTLIVVGSKDKSEPSLLDRLMKSQVNITFLEKPLKKGKIKTIIKLFRKIRELKPQIVHSHLELNSIYCAVISFFIHQPVYVQTIHSTKLYYEKLTKKFHKRFNSIVVISDEVEQSFVSKVNCNRNNLVKIYNGIDTKKFSPTGPTTGLIDSSRDTLKLVTVGRLSAPKGHEVLLKAIKLIGNQKKLKLYIVGDGEKRESLKILSNEMEINNKIEFLGNSDEIPSILRSVDMFVMPSHWEGLSIALLEAVSTGLPVVATDVGSNKRVLESCYVPYKVVTPNSAEEIAKAIIDLSDEIKQRKVAVTEKNTYLDPKFDIENFVREHETLYSRIVAERS